MIAADLLERLEACSSDELRVLDVYLRRLELGRAKYGPLDLSVPRDWQRERAEEFADAAFYQAAADLTRPVLVDMAFDMDED